jgi:hypothetical protein
MEIMQIYFTFIDEFLIGDDARLKWWLLILMANGEENLHDLINHAKNFFDFVNITLNRGKWWKNDEGIVIDWIRKEYLADYSLF